MKRIATTLCAAALAGSAGLASGAVLFQDSFDGETAGLNATPSQWMITNGGTTDIVSLAANGLACASPGGVGLCVDLDGSSGLAATLQTNAVFNLLAGVTYVLSYDLSGNQRNSPDDTVTASLGPVQLVTTLGSGAPFANYSLSLNLAVDAVVRISFEHAGADNVGIILDNVVLRSLDSANTPEPGALALLGLGLAGLAWQRRRGPHRA